MFTVLISRYQLPYNPVYHYLKIIITEIFINKQYIYIYKIQITLYLSTCLLYIQLHLRIHYNFTYNYTCK